MASLDYSAQLKNLVNAQKKAQTAELQNTRNQALSNLEAERAQNAANYATQRNTANAQNRLSARNFQEYLASTGRANSGLGAQAAMQYNNNLNTSLNNIYSAENAANADILKRQTDAKNAYSTGLAKANAEIQANYIQALLDQKAKAWERAMQEKEFKESVRQFNKNYELQKRNFSSGSGGGGYSGRGGNNGSEKPTFEDSPVQGYVAGLGIYPEFDFTSKKNNDKNNKKTSKGSSKNNTKTKKKSSGLSTFYSLKPKEKTKWKVKADSKLLTAKKKK